jgi:peptidoglycan/LPS O-acetylase OafA/YrhL
MRGIAALSVVALHEYQWLGDWTPTGGFLAVDLFFVLSGFVIAAAYERKLATGDLSVMTFVKTRAVRFWPLFMMGLFLGLGEPLGSLISNHGHITPVERDGWISILPGLLMLPCPPVSGFDAAFYPLDSVFWSLLFEMLVNLLYVFTWRFWTLRSLIGVMVVSGGILLASRGIGFDGWNWRDGGMDIARVMFSFPAGVLIWRLRPIPLKLAWWGGLLVMLACLASFLRRDPLLTEISVLAVFPLLVFLGSRAEPIGRLRMTCLFLGDISYALYALHDPMIGLIQATLSKAHIVPPGLLLAIGFVGLAVFGAWFADKYFDRPVRRRLSALAHGHLRRGEGRLNGGEGRRAS